MKGKKERGVRSVEYGVWDLECRALVVSGVMEVQEVQF